MLQVIQDNNNNNNNNVIPEDLKSSRIQRLHINKQKKEQNFQPKYLHSLILLILPWLNYSVCGTITIDIFYYWIPTKD